MEQQYLELLERCCVQPLRKTRNSNTYSLFGGSITHDLKQGFPLLTTKRVFFRGVVEELAWFLRGSTDAKELQDKNVHIWDLNAEQYDPEHRRDVGGMYGFLWRHFGAKYKDCYSSYDGVDQVGAVIRSIKENPYSRRHVIDAWDPSTPAAIPPCHVLYQFYVHENTLSVQMYQRSADLFLGVPFNIASTALLTHLIAHECGLGVGQLTLIFGDVHVYEEHLEAVRTQLQRQPRELPTISLDRTPDGLWGVTADQIKLHGYQPHPSIRAPMIA